MAIYIIETKIPLKKSIMLMERELYIMKNKIITSSLITILIIFNTFIAIKYYQNTKEYTKIKNTYYTYLLEKQEYQNIKANEENTINLYNEEIQLKQGIDEYTNKNNNLKNDIITIQNKINQQ